MEIKIRKKHPLLMVCLIVTLLVFPSCSSKFLGNSGSGGNAFKAMLSQFWANVRPVRDLAVAQYKLGRFYQQKGQHQKAIIEFKKAIHSYPEYITAHNALGMAYDAVSDYENAELAYSKAISLNPKLAYLYNNLGYSYLCRGDHDAAVQYFEKAANLDGKKSRINNNLQLARSKNKEKGSRSVGIEVANGNGVNGMARRTAGYLEKKGLNVYKISDAQHFGFSKTKILYKDGYLQEAYMVAKLIPGYQDFTKLNSLSSSNLHVRLLLGRNSISSQHILR